MLFPFKRKQSPAGKENSGEKKYEATKDNQSQADKGKVQEEQLVNGSQEQKRILQSPQSLIKQYRSKKKLKPMRMPKEKKTAQQQPVSTIYASSYRLLNKHVKFLYPRLMSLEPKLAKAMMLVPYEPYVCGMVMLSLIAGIVGIGIGVAISLVAVITPVEFEALLPVIMGMVMFQAIFALMYFLPAININGRRKRITEELLFFIGYMAMLASSGQTIEGIFRSIAKERTDEEIVKDAAFVVRNVDLLGMDILTSIETLARRSPHPSYTELLEGLIATVVTGGNLVTYFTSTMQVLTEEKRMILKRLTETMSIVAEMYTILLVVFPLMAIIMLAIMAIMAPSLGGFSLQTLMALLSYLFVPVLGGVMLMMVDGMLPKK
jgi:flagellar protein FlaJ